MIEVLLAFQEQFCNMRAAWHLPLKIQGCYCLVGDHQNLLAKYVLLQ